MSSRRVVSRGSSSSSSRWKFDVFLSFRGEDTRKNFTDHLYKALTRRRFNVFRDDIKLKTGKFISSELLKAIEESRISIVVFSKNYASSSWCLDELVKIVECMKKRGQRVIPVFCDVNQQLEREGKGYFHEALAKHEEVNNKDMAEQWRSALMEVINLHGKELKDRYESEFIEEIVKEISSKLIGRRLMMNLEKLGVLVSSWLEELRRQAETLRERERVHLWSESLIAPTLTSFIFFLFDAP